MRLSAQLKSKDHRDLLQIVDLTYGASAPEALFPPLFERLTKVIGCTSAMFGPVGEGGAPIGQAHGHLFAISLHLAREFAQYYWALDPFLPTGYTKEANRAVRVTDLLPANKYVNSEFVVDFCSRVPVCWALTGTVGIAGKSVGVMALHRVRHDHNFSDRHVAFVKALLPHLSRALHLFEGERPGTTGILVLDDVGTVVYSNDAAAHILKEKSFEAIRLPVSQEKTTLYSDRGSYAVGMQRIPGSYRVVSLEPMRYESLRSRFATMGLTPRQQEIASRALWGVSNKCIASELDLTEQTVKDHLNAVFRKLGIHHRAELAARVLPLYLNEVG